MAKTTMLQYLIDDVISIKEALSIVKTTQDKLDILCFNVLHSIVKQIDKDILSKEEALRLIQRRIKAYKEAGLSVPRYAVLKYNEVLIK